MVVANRRISVKWAQGRVVQPAYRQLACIEEVMFEQVSNEKSISGFRVNCPSPCESVPHCLSHVDGELPAATGLSIGIRFIVSSARSCCLCPESVD